MIRPMMHQRRQRQAGQPRGQLDGHLRHGQEIAEDDRARHDDHHHARGAHGLVQGLREHLPGELPLDRRDDACVPAAPIAAASVGVKQPANMPPITSTNSTASR